jgi:hypothetical protein
MPWKETPCDERLKRSIRFARRAAQFIAPDCERLRAIRGNCRTVETTPLEAELRNPAAGGVDRIATFVPG